MQKEMFYYSGSVEAHGSKINITGLSVLLIFPQCARGKGMTGGFVTPIGPINHLIMTDL